MLLQTQVHIRVRLESTQTVDILQRKEVLVLDIRGGVGRSEMPCHALSTDFISILRLYHLMQPVFLSFFWSTSYLSPSGPSGAYTRMHAWHPCCPAPPWLNPVFV